jgi:hypothetical protein
MGLALSERPEVQALVIKLRWKSSAGGRRTVVKPALKGKIRRRENR